MATAATTITFLLDQLADLPHITTRKMFGEYCVYVAGKPVALVCDDQLYLKMCIRDSAWNMAWCDPCADKPLTAPELRQAGVFWLGGNPDEEFRILGQSTQSPLSTTAAATPADGEPSNKRAAAVTRIAPPMPPPGAGTQQVMITRLHLRYTPESLAEDPMFVETRNQGNKQVRHILQQPWGGSVQSCNADLQAQNCETVCKPRVQGFLTPERRVIPGTNLSFNVDEQSLMADCKRACHVGKQEAQRRTQEYYGQILPKRRENEMANLMQLTGWSATEAERFVQRASPQQDRAKRDKTPSRGAANAAQRDATAPAASPSNVDTKPWWASLLGWR